MLENARHARNRLPFVYFFAHEKRKNEIMRGQFGLAHQISQSDAPA
jgi:hypothetical protein